MAKLRSQQLNPNFTGSFKVSGSFIVTGSLHSTNTIADSGSAASRLTVIETNIGQGATPTFKGLNLTDDTSITGSLSVTGDVIARSYIVSSSVSHFTQSFSSGSTAFGDTVDDSHTFIGNITASGNISSSATSTGSFAHTKIKDTFLLPVGTTAQRGTYSGSIRYSTTLSTFEGYDGANWGSLGGVIDVDQDTYITAETSAGTDNDELRFTTKGTTGWIMGVSGSLTGSAGTHLSASATSTGSFGRIETDVVEAKQFIVSSSVTNIVTIDVSGSTEFGDTLDDNHRFTGSVYIQSGSLAGEMHIVTNTDRMFVGRYGGGIPISGSVTASRYATGSDGSIIDIGFTTLDDNGNTVLTTTGDGLHVNDRNYWYNSEHYRVGSNHQYLMYDKSDVKVKGQLVVTSGSYDGEMYIDTGTSGSMGKMFIGKYTGGIPVSGSDAISRYATGSDGSIVDVGFTTVDEYGNTTLISTGDGIHVDNNNYWYTTGHFKIGSTTNYLNWDNTGLSVTGPLTASGDIIPSTHNSYDLGSDSARGANIYSADVHLPNDDSEGNEVDGTTGNWTIEEGNDDLFIINRKTGKKFKFLLQEVT